LKFFVPCVKRSPSPGNSSSSSYRRIRGIIQAERQHELSDKEKITCDETFWRLKWIKESPNSVHFDGITVEKTELGGRKDDFKVVGLLGEGAIGRVLLANKKSTGGHISREEVLALEFVPNKRVKEVKVAVFLRAFGHPFLVQLLTYFKTTESLCYVMQYMGGATVHSLCARRKRCNEDSTILCCRNYFGCRLSAQVRHCA